MAFCKSCGKELYGDSKFCNHCGTPVEEMVEAVDSPDPFKTVVKDAPAYGVVNLEQLPEGHVIDDRYEVKGKLGQGGFGAVYRVFDRKMECEKALKVLPEAVASDRAAMVGLKKEAVTMAKLNHPGIVHVYDFCDTGSIKYIDMEFVQGASLSDALVDAPEGRFDEAHVTRLARQLAEGFAYAHTQGVIHKDIKAQNILINASGEPKITDFGISETVKSSMSRIANSSSAGTLVYMAPEQIRGRDVGRESDIYSFGALLYELLSGHPPFYKGAIEHQILSEPVPPLEGVSDALSRLVLRCLEKEYTDRFRSFEEVLAALGGKDVPKGSKPVVTPEPKGKAAAKPVWMAAAAVVALVVAAGVYGLVGKGDTQPPMEPVNSAAIAEPVVPQGPEPVKKAEEPAADLPYLAQQDIKITECRETVAQLGESIEAMKGRLDSGQGKDGDSLEAMLGLIQKKKEKSADLQRLQGEKKNWKRNQLKKDIDTYAGLIATEEGKSLKETAWQQLIAKHPEEAEGVVPFDTEALWAGCRLTVTTFPEGAAVKILNIESAYAPGMKLKPGRYTVQVSKAGFISETSNVDLGSAKDKGVSITLKALPTLTITTTPSNAQVLLKGTQKSYSPGMTLQPGEYRVVVKAENHMPSEKRVALKAGDKKSVSVSLAAIGRLYVEREPSGAKVEISGIHQEYSAGMPLKPGTYTLQVSAEDYFSKTLDVQIKAGDTIRVAVDLLASKLKNSLGMEFVYIKPGTFMMGSPSGEKRRERYEDQHRVTLTKGYYLQTTEVTQGQWKALMGSNPSKFVDCGDNCPVEMVSWNDAQEFIRKLNTREEDSYYRLPTEAEWEYACRAGTTTPFFFGECLSTSQANFNGKHSLRGCSKGPYRKTTLPVASFSPNDWGLYDMHGNVYEWCQDWKDDYPSGHVTDPVGPSSGYGYVARGGSWYSRAEYCRSARRYSNRGGFDMTGFRIVRMP